MGAPYEPDIDIGISELFSLRETLRHWGKCNLLAVMLYSCYLLL